MSQVAREAEKRRRRKAKNRKTPGKIIRHSDIIKKREGVRKVAASAQAEEYRGGFKADIVKNKAYTFSSFYMPSDVATGDYKITAGYQTILVQTGQIFYSTIKTVDKGEVVDRGKLQFGESLTIKKGMTVRMTTGHIATDCLLIESGDFVAKQKTPPVKGTTGLDQYHNMRNVSGSDNTTRPARIPKTKEEREILGNKYLASRGVQTGQQKKAAKRSRVQDRGNNDMPAIIEGSNPQPIGDIG